MFLKDSCFYLKRIKITFIHPIGFVIRTFLNFGHIIERRWVNFFVITRKPVVLKFGLIQALFMEFFMQTFLAGQCQDPKIRFSILSSATLVLIVLRLLFFLVILNLYELTCSSFCRTCSAN